MESESRAKTGPRRLHALIHIRSRCSILDARFPSTTTTPSTIENRESRMKPRGGIRGCIRGRGAAFGRCIRALHSRKRFSMLNAIHIPSHPCIPSMLNSIHHHTIHPKAGPRRGIQGRHSGALKRTRIAYKRFLRLQTILIPSAQRKRNSGAANHLKTKANRAFSIENREEVKPRGFKAHPIPSQTSHPSAASPHIRGRGKHTQRMESESRMKHEAADRAHRGWNQKKAGAAASRKVPTLHKWYYTTKLSTSHPKLSTFPLLRPRTLAIFSNVATLAMVKRASFPHVIHKLSTSYPHFSTHLSTSHPLPRLPSHPSALDAQFHPPLRIENRE